MNSLQIFTLIALRKIASKCGLDSSRPPLLCEKNPNRASEMIFNLLTDRKPCMVARFGSTELAAVINYLGISSKKHSIWQFIKRKQPEWWWNKNIMNQMQQWSGFFPATEEKLSLFCEMMLKDAQEVNLLGSWLADENTVLGENSQVAKVHLLCLEPYWARNPWSRALEGKRVVVVHPFADDIVLQYTNHREQLFDDKRVLPKFASLRVIKAVQSLGGESNGFHDWFEALEWMQTELDKEEYDIALIGCGAYGFPLAAHAKRTGHKAVHLGGALQLLFGIKGKRWGDNYGVKSWGLPMGMYTNMFNDYWINPRKSNRPQNANKVEDGCYW